MAGWVDASGLQLAVRLAVAALFATAGARKAADPRGRATVATFLGDTPQAKTVATLLVPFEFVLATLLVVPATAGIATAVAALTLTAMAAVVARKRRQGSTAPCGCTGRASKAPSAGTVPRNLVLAIACAAVAGWFWFLVVVVTAAVAIAIRPRRPEPKPATAAPARPRLLVFLDDPCAPCRRLAPDVAAWQESPPPRTQHVSVLHRGDPTTGSLGITAYPAALIVDDASGRVVTGPAYGPAAIRDLLEHMEDADAVR